MTCTATSYGTGLIPQLLGNVDTAGCNYVQGAYQALSTAVTSGGSGTSVASLILILYVIFWAFGVWSGTATGSATDAAFRLFRAFVIYTLATSWNDFVTFAYTLLNTAPSAIGNALLSAGGTRSYTSPNAIVTALENIWNQISQAYQAHVAFSLFSLGAYVVGIACVVIIALFLAVATFTIILSKVFLWLLLGIAPLMILTLLFSASSRFFAGWLNSVVQYAVLQILVYAFLAFYLTVTQTVFANLSTTMSSGSVDWSAARAVCADWFDRNVFVEPAPGARGVDFRRHANVGAHGRRPLAWDFAASRNGGGGQCARPLRRMARAQ